MPFVLYFFDMNNFFSWIKKNKLLTVLIVVIFFLLYSQYASSRSPFTSSMSVMREDAAIGYGGGVANQLSMTKSAAPMALDSSISFRQPAPAPDVAERMVVSNSYLGLVVEDVEEGVARVKSYVQSIGGYMVNSSINRPEEGGTGTITVRIPSDKLDEVLAQLKGQAVKVVSENLDGTDVTDQFVDNEARLAILEQNKARFQEIMTRAQTVTDIVKVQDEIFNLQAQIDSIKGQQKYLEQTAKMSLVVVYLSTDELSLPYAPDQAWRPAVVFKLAVRSLVSAVQGFGSALIWLGVYAIIWLPILLVVIVVARKWRKSNPPSTT